MIPMVLILAFFFLVQPLQDIHELDGLGLVGGRQAEEEIHVTLGQSRRTGGAAHEDPLHALGHQAGRLAHRTVIRADDGPDAFLVEKSLGLRLAHVRLTLTVRMDKNDLVAVQDAFLIGQWNIDFGMFVIDDFNRCLHRCLAALSGCRDRTRQGEDGTDLDYLFGSQDRSCSGAEAHDETENDQACQPKAPVGNER